MQLDAMWSLGSFARKHTWAVIKFLIKKIQVTGDNHVLSKVGYFLLQD